MKNVQKTAVGGMTAALVSVIMLASNLIPIGQYALPAIAGVIIFTMSFVTGSRWGIYSFAAASLLSFIICADKETALSFALFFGYYPLIKAGLERIKLKPLSILCKFIVFNIAVFAVYFICLYVFGIGQNFEFFGVDLPLVFLIIMNFVFLAYDYMLSMFDKRFRQPVSSYFKKLMH